VTTAGEERPSGTSDVDEDAESLEDSATKVSKDQAMQNVAAQKELTGADLSQGGGEIGPGTLSQLVTFHPFMSFFCWLAHRQFSAQQAPEARVAQLKMNARGLYWLCVTLDLLVVLVSVLLLIAAASAVLYKTIWLSATG
jgi:hypothetical protein